MSEARVFGRTDSRADVVPAACRVIRVRSDTFLFFYRFALIFRETKDIAVVKEGYRRVS